MKQKVLVSAGVLVYVNGAPYAQCRGISFDSESPRSPENGIDTLDPVELAPTKTVIRGRVEVYRLLGDGGAEGTGFTTSFDKLPREKYFSLLLLDKLTNAVIFRADYCSVVRQNWSLGSRDIVRGSIDFEALDWTNEANT